MTTFTVPEFLTAPLGEIPTPGEMLTEPQLLSYLFSLLRSLNAIAMATEVGTHNNLLSHTTMKYLVGTLVGGLTTATDLLDAWHAAYLAHLSAKLTQQRTRRSQEGTA